VTASGLPQNGGGGEVEGQEDTVVGRQERVGDGARGGAFPAERHPDGEAGGHAVEAQELLEAGDELDEDEHDDQVAAPDFVLTGCPAMEEGLVSASMRAWRRAARASSPGSASCCRTC